MKKKVKNNRFHYKLMTSCKWFCSVKAKSLLIFASCFFAQIFVSSVVKVKKFFSAILEINIYIIFPNVKKPDVVQGFSLSAWKNTIFAAQFSIKFGGT